MSLEKGRMMRNKVEDQRMELLKKKIETELLPGMTIADFKRCLVHLKKTNLKLTWLVNKCEWNRVYETLHVSIN